MGRLDRLREIHYQFRKPFKKTYSGGSNIVADDPLPIFTNKQMVEIAQSLTDAVIDAGDPITDVGTLPSDLFGVTMQWTENSTTITMVKGDVELTDDMADTVVPIVPLDMSSYLSVSGELFFLRSGENLLLRTA